jgi:response regulator NasT
MSPLLRSLRIAVADDEPDVRQFFQELLPRLGHQLVGVAATGRELTEQCRTASPDLVITDIRMRDMDGLEAAAEVNRERPIPVILVTAHPDVDFLARAGQGHIMAYLVKPVKPADLQAAILLAMVRFEEFRKVSQEAANLRQALEDRKLIERAKGAVMKWLHVGEEEAFRRLRKLASDQNLKLVEVAERVLTADEVFRGLEKF